MLYGGVLGVTALLYGWAQKVKWQRILHLAGIGAVAVIFGMIVFGFFPYTTNTIKNKHPFYSAFRIDKQGKKHNQMYHFLSDDLNKHTRFGKTWISLFSKPSKKNWFRAEPLPPFSSIKHSLKLHFYMDPNPYKKEEERLIELKGGRGSALNQFFFDGLEKSEIHVFPKRVCLLRSSLKK